MAAANVDSEGDIRPVTCLMHPNCSKEFYFCVDCSRVFCGDCRSVAVERVNHKKHHSVPLQAVLIQRKERMPTIQRIIRDYSNKHDMLLSALLKLEEAQKHQTETLNGIIDDLAAQLYREVENLKATAKATIAKRSTEIYSANPEEICRKEIDSKLQKMREVRAAIEHEVQLCKRDELYLVEKNRDLESFATELSEFQKKTVAIPDESRYQLTYLQYALLYEMSLMKRKFNNAKEAFLKGIQESNGFPQPERLCVLSDAVITFPKEKLTFPNDREKFPSYNGAIPADEHSEAIFFVDKYNSKVKMLDLNTGQLTELFSGPSGTELIGLVNVEENENGALIATTEHTKGTSAKVRVLFLRRNSGATAAGRLEVVQSVTLNSAATGNLTTFAPFAGGNVFCAVMNSRSLHELCRSPGASAAVFENTARTHSFRKEVIAVCSFLSKLSGEWRLAASFGDTSLRVLGVSGASLIELHRIQKPDFAWCPTTIFAPPGGSLLIHSFYKEPTNSMEEDEEEQEEEQQLQKEEEQKGKEKQQEHDDDEEKRKEEPEEKDEGELLSGIECCATKADGSLAAPKLLHSHAKRCLLIGLLPPTHSFPDFRLVVTSRESEISVYPIAPKSKLTV